MPPIPAHAPSPSPARAAAVAKRVSGDAATPTGPIAACVGVAPWKRPAVVRLLSEPEPPVFARSPAAAVRIARVRGGAVAVWATREPAALAALARKHEVPLARLEDGFIRSAGLGAECRPPCSIVVDWRGLHLDPAQPSDLELILAEERFSDRERERAERLIETIVTLGVTKYNLPEGEPSGQVPGRRAVLVAGQVEDDLSVRRGDAGVAGNLDLLRRARALEPEADLLYRPHPDVAAGHRRGALRDAVALRYADRVVLGESLPSLLARVDAVHVLTSLTGFEALLRGVPVITHGQPFYAGWGLTRDLAPPPRRGRNLTLAELAAGALIRYPRYIDPETGRRCEVEAVVERLAVATPAADLLPVARRLEARIRRAAGVSPRAWKDGALV